MDNSASAILPWWRAFVRNFAQLAKLGLLTLLGLFIFSILFTPRMGGIKYRQHNAWLQTSRTIELSMFMYANDNNDRYPDGKSSTELFQKLIDGGYIADPAIFYLPLPGKTKPVIGQPLKPENVCWDVTYNVDGTDSPLLPVVFMTGYRMNYVAGGSAVPLIKPYPDFGDHTWFGEPSEPPALAVSFKGNTSRTFLLAPDGTVPNIIPPEFKSNGKIYRQLTPDGILK